MLYHIKKLLRKRQLENVRELLDHATFVDGKISAGKVAQRVKNNEEMTASKQQMEYLNTLVLGRLADHPLFKVAALPHRMGGAFFARYTAGMEYGEHIDDPIMGPMGGRYRTDVSSTIFLSGPDEYEGGELEIKTPFGDNLVKCEAGDAVFYPSGSLHRVRPVTSGVRLVAVTWTQSMIRDPNQRAVLAELGQAREQMLEDEPEAELTRKIDHSYINLVRMWAEV